MASEKGQSSANNLEDDFASKTTLEKEDELNWEAFDSDDESEGRIWESYCRYVIENGQEVELPANQYCIYLKEGPPEGCDRLTYHLDILKQVVGSDAKEVYSEAISDTMLAVILTDEEQDKLSDMEQVAKSVMANGCFYLY